MYVCHEKNRPLRFSLLSLLVSVFSFSLPTSHAEIYPHESLLLFLAAFPQLLSSSSLVLTPHANSHSLSTLMRLNHHPPTSPPPPPTALSHRVQKKGIHVRRTCAGRRDGRRPQSLCRLRQCRPRHNRSRVRGVLRDQVRSGAKADAIRRGGVWRGVVVRHSQQKRAKGPQRRQSEEHHAAATGTHRQREGGLGWWTSVHSARGGIFRNGGCLLTRVRAVAESSARQGQCWRVIIGVGVITLSAAAAAYDATQRRARRWCAWSGRPALQPWWRPWLGWIHRREWRSRWPAVPVFLGQNHTRPRSDRHGRLWCGLSAAKRLQGGQQRSQRRRRHRWRRTRPRAAPARGAGGWSRC